MKLFGTDGIRGQANSTPLTPEMITQIAMAVGHQFHKSRRHKLVVIGKDTRLSGYMIETALTAGFSAVGLDVILLGPVPTPAVAFLTRSLRADLGVMISASHNPYADNGLKFFGPDGYKLSDEMEQAIEHHFSAGTPHPYASVDDLGKAHRLEDVTGRYIEFVKSTFPKGLRLDGLKIVVDCANGAAYKVAPTVLWELGADIIPLAITPDGRNINHQCGALSPAALIEAVQTQGAHLGLALDGDADRVVLVDEKGCLLDGDQLIALIAQTWHKQGRLQGDTVVTTLMSNLGLERYLQSQHIQLLRTAVGDRHVVAKMRQHNLNVGGEQSGHIILSDYITTGDGLIAALQVVAAVLEAGRPVSEVAHLFEPMPQILKNVRVPAQTLQHPQVKTCIAGQEARLGKAGRILVRPSGTEALIRVMAEGDDLQQVNQAVNEIVNALQIAGAA